MSRILRVFPRRTKATPTDELAFIGLPGLFLPPADTIDAVHISITFHADAGDSMNGLRTAWEHHYPGKVLYGGPAFGLIHASNREDTFVPGRYLRLGYTITSRGCPNACPWCMVPVWEGQLREIRPIPDGYIVQDNNLLACSDRHIELVFEMLTHQRRAAKFAGGFEAERVTPALVTQLQALRIKEIWLAFDDEFSRDAVVRAIGLLRKAGLTRRQVRCYVLAAFEEADTPAAAEARCEDMLGAGALPFVMLYQPPECRTYRGEWAAVRRKWTRPAAMLARKEWR